MGLSQQIGASSLSKPGVCTSTTRPATPYEGQMIYETDTDLTLIWSGAAWQRIIATLPIATFNETQTAGTNGGTFVNGSYLKRTLNTTVVNNITNCTLSSSVISLPAGTYSVTAFAPTYTVSRSKLRLRNTTDSTTIAAGVSTIEGSGGVAMLQTVFTLTGTKNIELQHRCETTVNTNGFGVASNFGENEVYATIEIQQVA